MCKRNRIYDVPPAISGHQITTKFVPAVDHLRPCWLSHGMDSCKRIGVNIERDEQLLVVLRSVQASVVIFVDGRFYINSAVGCTKRAMIRLELDDDGNLTY